MSRARARSLGARLATSTALIAALAVAVFAIVAAAVLWQHEEREAEHEAGDTEAGEGAGEAEVSPADEVLTQMAIALAVTTPVVLVLAVLGTRRVARRLTARVDAVVDQATRMTHEDLGQRLPVSAAGDELDTMSDALNGLFNRLQRGLAAQHQFVADASHELRTPLSVLRTELEVARRHPRAAAEWEALAERATAEVTRMTEMVEALLRLARTDAGGAATTPVDGDALVDDVVTRWTALARGAEVSLEARAGDAGDAGEVTGAVIGDSEALAVALGNLVKNAIAHSPRGGVVTVSARRAGDHVELAVADRGAGVAAADRERIFLPFARGAASADRDGDGGVGLGLSVARRIAVAHHGDLRVDDAPGGGARFTMRLPAAA